MASTYQQQRQGLDRVARGNPMRGLMSRAGARAASIAGGYAKDTGAVRYQLTSNRGRAAVNVVHSAKDALLQEYGGRSVARRAPLGRALDVARAADPHRRVR